MSVLRDDRSAEMVVHAGARRIEIMMEAICRADIRRRARDRQGHARTAEIDMEIFSLEAPVRREHPFETGAGRPAKSRLARATRENIGFVATDDRARRRVMNPAKGEAARSIE